VSRRSQAEEEETRALIAKGLLIRATFLLHLSTSPIPPPAPPPDVKKKTKNSKTAGRQRRTQSDSAVNLNKKKNKKKSGNSISKKKKSKKQKSISSLSGIGELSENGGEDEKNEIKHSKNLNNLVLAPSTHQWVLEVKSGSEEWNRLIDHVCFTLRPTSAASSPCPPSPPADVNEISPEDQNCQILTVSCPGPFLGNFPIPNYIYSNHNENKMKFNDMNIDEEFEVGLEMRFQHIMGIPPLLYTLSLPKDSGMARQKVKPVMLQLVYDPIRFMELNGI